MARVAAVAETLLGVRQRHHQVIPAGIQELAQVAVMGVAVPRRPHRRRLVVDQELIRRHQTEEGGLVRLHQARKIHHRKRAPSSNSCVSHFANTTVGQHHNRIPYSWLFRI
jgi:hypothetical protein